MSTSVTHRRSAKNDTRSCSVSDKPVEHGGSFGLEGPPQTVVVPVLWLVPEIAV